MLCTLELRQGDGKAHDFSRGMRCRFAKPAVRNAANDRFAFAFASPVYCIWQRGVKSRANLSPFWGTTYLENWEQRVGASTLKGEDVRPTSVGCLCRS